MKATPSLTTEVWCTCVKCGKVKPQEAFGAYYDKGVKKYKRKCKECLQAYQREYQTKKRAARDAGKPAPRIYNEDGTIKAKRCKLCEQYKPLEAFSSNQRTADKKTACCRPCDQERVRKWRLDNLEQSRASVKAYQAANKEAVKARNARWKAENREHLRAWAAEYRERNRDQMRAYYRTWLERTAQEKGTTVRGVFKSWYEQYDGAKRRARREQELGMNVPAPDHIIAEARKEQKTMRLRRWATQVGVRERLRANSRNSYWRDPEKSRRLSRQYAQRRRLSDSVRRRIAFLAALNQKQRGLRTPSWVDWREMYALRALARRLTKETGVVHELDHIYPVCSPYVCGLNVHQNLRVVPQIENRSKGNKLLRNLAHEHFVTNPNHLYPRKLNA